MKTRLSILAALGVICAAHKAQASASFTYTAMPATGSITFGAGNTINLYLEETDTLGTSSFIGSDGNLYSGAVAFLMKSTSTGVTVNSASNNSANEPNGFTGNNNSGTATSGGSYSGGAYVIDITNSSDKTPNGGVTPAITSTVGTTTTNLYLLGSVSLTVASIANASFSVESLHDAPTNNGILDAGTNGNTLTFNHYYDLDTGGTQSSVVVGTGANGNGTTFTINSAPEPASLALLLCGGAAGLLVRRKQPR